MVLGAGSIAQHGTSMNYDQQGGEGGMVPTRTAKMYCTCVVSCTRDVVYTGIRNHQSPGGKAIRGLAAYASSVSFGHPEHCFLTVWTPKNLCQNFLMINFLRR